MIEAVLFDLGDTLYRYESNDPRVYFDRSVALAHAYLRERGLPLPALGTYARNVRRRMIFAFLLSRLRRREIRPIETLRRIHRHIGIEIDFATAESLARRFFEPIRIAGQLDADAPQVLAQLRDAGLRMAIISNTFSPPCAIDDQLRDDGIYDFFPVRVYSCDSGYMKPHPVIFRTALDQLNVPAPRAMYVGDRPNIDVRGAARVGMVTVLKIRRPSTARIRPTPHYTIERLTDLPAILQNHPS